MALRSGVVPAFLALVALVSMSQAVAGAEPAGERWALVVGIDRYENDDISQLSYAVADARSFSDALTAKAIGFRRDRVFLMTSEAARTSSDRPTRANVVKRLDGLAAKIGPEDTFFFYFSGHGYQLKEGGNFLGTVEANPESIRALERSSIPLDVLRQKIARIRARKVVFVVDACRSDPEASRSLKDNRLTGAFARDLVVVAHAAASGLAGTAVFFACSAGERAYEWNEKRHGVFSYYLLEGLRGRAADPTGRLTMPSLGDYVQKRVMAWAGERGKTQRPDLYQQGAAAIELALFKPSGAVPSGGIPEPTGPAGTTSASGGPPRVVVIIPVQQGNRVLPDSVAETEFIQQLLKAGYRVVDQMHYAERRKALADEVSRDFAVVPRVGKDLDADILIVGTASAERGEDPMAGIVSCQARVQVRAIAAATSEILGADTAAAPGAHLTEGAAAGKAVLDATRKLAPRLIQAITARRAP